MSTEPTNGDLYVVLLGIKEDIGGLKTGQGIQLEALKNHSGRIEALEGATQRQRGFVTALGMAASGLGAALGWILEKLTFGHH